jgi:hypothetical protein
MEYSEEEERAQPCTAPVGQMESSYLPGKKTELTICSDYASSTGYFAAGDSLRSSTPS